MDVCRGFNHKYVLVLGRRYVSTGLPTQHLQTPEKSTQLFATKALDRIPMCPRERLVLISISTGLSFDEKDWATCCSCCCRYYLHFVLLLYQKTNKNPFAKYLQRFIAPYH